MLKSLTVWIITNCRKFNEMGIPGHLISLMRNLYAGQEATVRNLYGKTGSKLRKEYKEVVILLPCLFNLYAKHIMQMPGWMSYRMESRLPGDISTFSDMQIIPLS